MFEIVCKINNFWHCIAVKTLRIWKSVSVETIQHTSTGTGMNKIVRNMNIKPLLAIPECWALISQIPLPYPAYFLHNHSNQGIYQENPCWRSPRGKGQCPVGQGKNGMALSGLALSECIKSVNIVKHKLLFTSPHPLLHTIHPIHPTQPTYTEVVLHLCSLREQHCSKLTSDFQSSNEASSWWAHLVIFHHLNFNFWGIFYCLLQPLWRWSSEVWRAWVALSATTTTNPRGGRANVNRISSQIPFLCFIFSDEILLKISQQISVSQGVWHLLRTTPRKLQVLGKVGVRWREREGGRGLHL